MTRVILELIGRFALSLLVVLAASTAHAATVGADNSVPVASLAPNDPVRQAAQPVGLLRSVLPDGTAQICTAIIISDRHILTAAHCAVGAENLTVVFGLTEQARKSFRVQGSPSEIDKQRGYAVFDVEGTPSQTFGTAKLLLRIPLKGESAFFVGMNEKAELRTAANCSVLGTNSQGTILHDCDTAGGGSGGLLYSVRDLAILGLHNGSDGRTNQASPMYLIALASDLIRESAARAEEAAAREAAAREAAAREAAAREAAARQAAAAREIVPVKPPVIDFRTVGNKPDEIAADFKRLYVALFNDGRLPLKLYQTKSFTTIEDAFRRNRLFYGSPFPVELDSIACDLNPKICERGRVEPSPEEQRSGAYIRDVIPDLKRPTGKSRPSIGTWHVEPPASLLLPSVPIEEEQGWVVYRKRAGQKISDIVVRELGTCDQYDDQCKNRILAGNRNQEERLRQDYSGVVLLPKMSYIARSIDISTASEKGSGLTVEITPPASSEQSGPLVLRTGEVPGKASQSTEPEYRIQAPGQVTTAPGLEAVFKSLGTTASGSARLAPNSTALGPEWDTRCKGIETDPCELDPSELSKFQKRVLEGLAFPYKSLSDYPVAVQQKGGSIGVVDTDLDLTHCAFEELTKAGRLKPIETGSLTSTPTPTPAPIAAVPSYAPCTWLKPSKLISSGTHGTHVASLMVGKVSDKLWGINPFATLYAGQISQTVIGQEVEVSSLELASLLRKMLNAAPKGLDVVNISMFYQKVPTDVSGGTSSGGADSRGPHGDPVLDVIRGDAYETLFVIAAGNAGEEFTAICDMRPACLDLPNVISVAALDRGTDAALLALAGVGSNFGRRVHVAAPGADILGSVKGNFLGLLSGTSQAAPQVAAIASLLRAMRPKAAPADVKERLITCSKSVPAPIGTGDEETNAIFGGRVDSSCALIPEGDGLLQDKSGKRYRVKNVTNSDDADLEFRPVISDYAYSIVIPPWQLRGLRANANPRELTIFHKRSPENSRASLSKDARVFAKYGTLRLDVMEELPGGGLGALEQGRAFPVKDIVRYVAPMVKR
ncbi:S8 family serine peptidase [Bradyrhizobium vignae]|uniref:S8 family serine peptidase n=1 Tax=Bradyrhizobium vignae TaxID=1549949 RepID=UPI00100A6523|nr:S8 family serine peptidase [Bradyrhizobium vignae]RXG84339.1 trypsin-like serine protease [Bradyrhizobium vignae]